MILKINTNVIDCFFSETVGTILIKSHMKSNPFCHSSIKKINTPLKGVFIVYIANNSI
jgi:hypothetical protein